MSNPLLGDTTNVGVNDIRTLLLLVASPETAVCINALESLTKFADAASKHRLQLLNLDITTTLLNLIQNQDINIRKAAVACLAAATEITDSHPDMKKKDVLECLISLLSSEQPPEVHDEAAFALSNYAKDFGNKSLIRKLGGIGALVNLLESTDPDVKKNVALALAIVLEDFSNRTEIRYAGGLQGLFDLLSSDFKEIQLNALLSLIRCAEDFGNRVELRKLNIVRRVLDLLNPENQDLHQLSLLLLATCLEDAEMSTNFPLTNGIPIVTKFISEGDNKCKQYASWAIHRAAKLARNQMYAKDAGAIPFLVANLSSADSGVVSAAAMALSNLAKNDVNQIEIGKLGAVDSMVKLLSHENIEVKRQCVLAVSSMCANPKVRSRIRNIGIQNIVSLMGDDLQLSINTAECLANLAEDGDGRSEIAKNNGITLLGQAILKSDVKLQSVAALALARCLNDAECRIGFGSKPANVNALIELIKSKDVKVSRHAALALSNACELETISHTACQNGAIEALLSIMGDTKRSSSQYAVDSLGNLLDHHLSAKYWLRNRLDKENVIVDGFYDFGSAGVTSSKHNMPFPSLETLKGAPIDKKREVILIDARADAQFNSLVTSVTDGLAQLRPVDQIRRIAEAVVSAFGGPVANSGKVSELGFKFKAAELKLQCESNVIPIGMFKYGTFYHRALLFKAICDRVGVSPCTLVRGDYNRAWNEIDLKRWAIQSPKLPASAPATSAAKPNQKKTATMVEPPAAPSALERRPSNPGLSGGAGGGGGGGVTEVYPNFGMTVEPGQEAVLVDLMFEPGRLLEISSPAAIEYQHS